MKKNKTIIFIYPSMNAGGVPKRVILFASLFKKKGYKVFIVCKDGDISHIIKEKQINVIKLSEKFQNSSNKLVELCFYFYTTLYLFFKLIKVKPALIVNDSRYTSIIAKILSILLSAKYYSVAHGSYEGYTFLKEWVWGNKILAVSNSTKQNLIEKYNITPEKIFVIKNSIKPLKYSNSEGIKNFREKYNIENKNIISSISRFDPIKNVFMTVKAWKNIYWKEIDTILLLIAHGEKENEIRKYIENNNLVERTLIINNITDVSTVISASKFTILTSKREGLPTVVLESFSLGKPVIATDVRGTREIVKENYNGILVNPKSVNNLSRSIIELLNNSNKLKKLSIGAKKTYELEFSFEDYKKNIFDFFVKNM